MSYNSKYIGAEIDGFLDLLAKGGKQIIDHGTADTEIEVTPGVIHKWDAVSSLVLTFPDDEEGVVGEYSIVFTAGEGFSLSVPVIMRWANNAIPSFVQGMQYEMSVANRRILISAFNSPIPQGEFLEYVENDGTDYVLTDIYMSDMMYGVRCKSAALFDGDGSNYVIAGTRQTSASTSDTSFFLWYMTSTSDNYRRLYWNGANAKTFGVFVNGTVYEDLFDGVQNTVASDYPLVVFGANNAGSPRYNNKFRFYYLDILGSDGLPLVSLKPFRRASDNAVGLLDVVSGQFYPSVNGNLTEA